MNNRPHYTRLCVAGFACVVIAVVLGLYVQAVLSSGP